jgi:hypothetical protein
MEDIPRHPRVEAGALALRLLLSRFIVRIRRKKI